MKYLYELNDNEISQLIKQWVNEGKTFNIIDMLLYTSCKNNKIEFNRLKKIMDKEIDIKFKNDMSDFKL